MKRTAQIVIYFFAFAAALHAAPIGSPDRVAELRALLAKSDALLVTFNYDEAKRVLEEADQKFANNAEVLWRLSSLLINIGDVLPENEAAYRKAMTYGEAAVKADYNNSNAHAYLAAAYGSYAMFAGGKEKVKLANQIRDELDKALKLDPNNQIAHSVYGSWNRAVANVSWIERGLANMFLGGMPKGSFAEAIDHLQKAIRIAPNVFRHRFELGLTYNDANMKDLAIKSLEAALRCPPNLKADIRRKMDARKFLSELRS